jgi:hypothetical protein
MSVLGTEGALDKAVLPGEATVALPLLYSFRFTAAPAIVIKAGVLRR